MLFAPAIQRLTLVSLATLLLAVQTDAAERNTLTKQQLDEGWISLFDGKTLFGWTPASEADWKVSDGAIVVARGEKGLLHTNTQFADYILRVDFRSAKGTNSGIFLRTGAAPKNAKDGCYELNIADFDSTPYSTGSLVARGEKAKVRENLDSTDWQTFEVTLQGPKITVRLDGRQVLAYQDDAPTLRGLIGLQLNSGKVEFRNICLKPLGQKPIFNGKDLTGWVAQGEADDLFAVTPQGELRVKGGRGQLETATKFGDFSVQMEIFSHTAGSNSGLFFRSIPGQMTNGYECQIQNSYGKGGENNLIDCGTGGICRRQKARAIVAQDKRWYYLTLIATGPHMAAWVDGRQVSDFTDARKPHKNPRKGLRLEAGTLILQAHDGTTDYSFRNMRAVEMQR